VTEKQISRVAIVGFGTLGRVITFYCIRAGYPTSVFDIQPHCLEEGGIMLQNWLAKMNAQARLSKGKEDETLSRFKPSANLEGCVSDADLVIEVVPEERGLKYRVFSEMDRLAPPETILASNTSSFKCSFLAEATDRPEKVIIIHFSVDIAHVVADIKWAANTSDDTIRAAVRFVKSLDLIPFLSPNDMVAFPFNRVWRAVKRESLHLIGDEGVNFEDLDRAWMLVNGTKFGPFGLMDMIGLDAVRNVELEYYRLSGRVEDKPPQFLDDMIAKGYIGVKAGRGFYSYPDPDYQQADWLYKKGKWEENLEAVLAKRKNY